MLKSGGVLTTAKVLDVGCGRVMTASRLACVPPSPTSEHINHTSALLRNVYANWRKHDLHTVCTSETGMWQIEARLDVTCKHVF